MAEPIQQRVEVENAASGELQKIARDGEELKRSQDRLSESSREAESIDQQRARSLAAKRDRLVELQRREIALERAVELGSVSETQAERVSERRQRQIDRLARSLGAEQRAQRLASDAVRDSSKATQDNTQVTDRATQSAGRFGGGLDGALSAANRLAGGLIGAGGLLVALRLIGAELREDADAAREFQEAFLNLQFLNTDFNEQEKKFVQTAAVFGGRAPAETATAFAELKSFFPNKPDDELQSLYLEILETGRTTDAGLSSLTSAYAGIYQQTGDAQQSQNILRETLVQAGSSDPATISRALGKFLSPGQGVGGLTTAQSAGLVAGATGLDTRNPEEQITGLRTILLRLLGTKSDEQQEIIERGGIDTADFLSAIDTFGQAVESGRLSREDIDRLVGAEAITTATALSNPELRADVLAKVQAVVDASNNPDDLTAQAIQSQFEGDEASAINFALKQEEARQTVLRLQDNDPSRHQLARLNLNNQLRQAGFGPVERGIATFFARAGEFVGLDADASIRFGGEAVQFGNADVRSAIDIAQNRTELQSEGVLIENDGIDLEDFAQRMAREAVERREREDGDAAPGKQAKASIVIQKQTIINGTQINNGTNPATGDRELPREGRGR